MKSLQGPTMEMRESREFANMFQLSVVEGLANTLGSIVMQTLKTVLSYSLETYAEKPSELHRELSRVFGTGAANLERMITKELFQRLSLRYSNELDFETSVNLARRDMTLSERGNN
ncbi:MAG TPA: hypothetical protein VNA15_08350 [Candidatus Angelobacter sp.]|nr:hypothetical protein [Candidatus Angelobacter sp.]